MSEPLAPVTFTPIGVYHSDAKAPYEAARQPLGRVTTLGEVILNSGQLFEQALEDLEGFERVWLIYQFHHNPHWKPKVLPPRGSDKKVGVFATRAPYRPNPIGISSVKLINVTGLKLQIEGADLLDGTPILDIKPYLPYADAFPDVATGWLGNPEPWTVTFSAAASEEISFLASRGLGQLQDFIQNQLEHDPLNADKKRVTVERETAVLAYKTWRVRFSHQDSEKRLVVNEIFSGYQDAELAAQEDRYKDKHLHREFLNRFSK